MPEVPNVDVHGFGGFGQKHDDVDQDAKGNHRDADRRSEGDGRGAWPSNVDDGQIQSKQLDHVVDRGLDDVRQNRDGGVQSDKADSD